jgi:undecaprenyl-diphosphatase
MSVFHAVVLGIVQGLTEFLPVSSSGHLIVVPRMLGWEEQPLAFDVALHLGTTLAVLLYFWRDFVRLTRHGLGDIVTRRLRIDCYSPFGRLAVLIVVGCVPAVIVGGLFNTWIEDNARQAWLVATMLVVFGLVMLAAERWGDSASGLERLNMRRSLLIGAGQAMALIPGVSRSGTTIAAGMFSGLSRATAARFSFLLAAPVIVAAGIKELPDIRHASAQGVSGGALAAGFLVSFAVGLLTVHLFLRYVASHPLSAFVWYRFGFAALVLLLLGLR